MRAIASSALAGLAVACAPDGPLMLDELDQPSMFVLWYGSTLGQELPLPHFYVQVSPRHVEGECPSVVPEVVARVGEHELSVIALGGLRELDGETSCTVPTFELPGQIVLAHPDEPTTTIELSDGTTTLGLTARNLFAERDASLQAPAAAELLAGEPATVQWSPATDVLGLVAVYGYPVAPQPTAPSFTLSGSDLELHGDRIDFVVPASAEPGPATLRIDVSAEVPTEDCRGLHQCRVEVLGVRRELAVTIR